MDEATLNEQYLVRYERGEVLMLNGRSIHPVEIARFRVFKNGKSSQQVMADINAEFESAARSGVLSFRTPSLEEIVFRGTEITNDIVKGPPGFAKSAASSSRSSDNISVFLSHSSKDEKLAYGLIDCISKSMVVPEGKIRCTSVPGFKLRAGDDADDTLRNNLEHASIVIGLLSEESLASGYVIMELGAAWGLKRTTCAILTPGVDFRMIPGPLAGKHAIRSTNESDIAALMEQMSHILGWPLRNRASMTEGIRRFVGTGRETP